MASALLRTSARAPLQARGLANRFTMAIRHGSTGGHLRSYIVSPKDLSEALQKNVTSKLSTSPRVIPLCASWFLPNDPEGRTGRQVFEQRRIPSAKFFDLDAVKDHDSPYPHMLPTAEVFAEAMRDLGIKRDDTLVVYDTYERGIFSAPRVAWTLRVFGHPQVHVLNNFKVWVDDGYPTEWGPEEKEQEKTKYPDPNYNAEPVVCFREVKSIAMDHGKEGSDCVQIIDARSPGRFNGTEPEPRPGLSNGHIPGSVNLPLDEILDPQTRTLLPKEQLRKLFESKGLDPTAPIISSCGTGVMAAALDAALAEADFGHSNDRRVYDGSWTEYAQRIPKELIHKST